MPKTISLTDGEAAELSMAVLHRLGALQKALRQKKGPKRLSPDEALRARASVSTLASLSRELDRK